MSCDPGSAWGTGPWDGTGGAALGLGICGDSVVIFFVGLQFAQNLLSYHFSAVIIFEPLFFAMQVDQS